MPYPIWLLVLHTLLFFLTTTRSLGAIGPGGIPWETCYVVEGKDAWCKQPVSSAPFSVYLDAAVQAKQTGEHAHLLKPLDEAGNPISVRWREVEGFAAKSLRLVEFRRNGNSLTGTLVAEMPDGSFGMLMSWTGEIPQVQVLQLGETPLLVLERNYGGNRPMYTYWVWTWSDKGPTRQHVPAVLESAIEKVKPGYTGYPTGIDWKRGHTRTWIFPKGKQQGLFGEQMPLDIWLMMDGDRLVPEKVVLQDGGREIVWERD